jgi:UDP:flavonoid glycosyltransferase YjiC (YdhE family)
MAKIAFVPHPQMGHINPTVRLAKKLQQRGHQVEYLSLSDFESYISSQGLGFVPILSREMPKGFLAEQARRNLNSNHMWQRLHEVPWNPFDGIREQLKAVRPDLVLVDMVLRDLALLFLQDAIPCALIATDLEEARLHLINAGRDPADELPVLVLCPREFDFPDAAKKKGRFSIEPSIDLARQEPGQLPWDAVDGARPLLYCTLGSHCEDYPESEGFFRAVLDAMAEKPDWQMVLARGNHHADVVGGQQVPPNVLLVNWAPQLAVLERASMMMTHGGLGTIKECILFGVPMVVFPVRYDQPRNAERVVYHGLGVQGTIGDVSPRQIHRLIDEVAGNPSFRERARQMGRTFRAIEESGIGVKTVETILATLPEGL